MKDSILSLTVSVRTIRFITRFLIVGSILFLFPVMLFASQPGVVPSIAGIRIEFILFALTLIGVAVFHQKTMYVALIGLTSILLFKFAFAPDFSLYEHILGSPAR